MTKYQLRKLDPQSRCENRYSSCDEFASFSSLRDALNQRSDIWYGNGFDVLNTESEVIFDHHAALYCIQIYGKQFTLAQVTEQYGD
ncbi:hypothetical protein WAB73_003297 [Salmonella enterica subsp. enterica]